MISEIKSNYKHSATGAVEEVQVSFKQQLVVVNGKSETRQDAETGILKSEPKTKKCSDIIDDIIEKRN